MKQEVSSNKNKYILLVQAVLTFTFLTYAYSAHASHCHDPDGDGFGWNGNTCRVPQCIQTNRNDGYGWNNETRSNCKLSEVCQDISRGDGYGYDFINSRSCRLLPQNTINSNGNNNSANSSSSNSSECSDTGIGNGWGWNFTSKQSCLIPNFNICRDTPPYGNGWGWNNSTNSSCRLWDAPQTASASVQTTSNNTSIGQTSSNFEFNGTSNNDSVPGHLFNKRDCEQFFWDQNRGAHYVRHTWAAIPYRDYMVQHNIWNDGAMKNDKRRNISLCTELRGNSNDPKPYWSYNFLGEHDGGPTEVKAYPQVYYGTKYKSPSGASGSQQDLGVPARINQMDEFQVQYKYSENRVGERNVSLESFFHPNNCYYASEGERQQQLEMMVWVGRPTKRTGGNIAIAGGNSGKPPVWIDGAQWEVYLNSNLNWRYIAYVKTSTSKEGTLNWNNFVEYTKNEAYKLDSRAPRLASNECMNGIEMGTEIFFGNGDFTLDKFNVIRYKRN